MSNRVKNYIFIALLVFLVTVLTGCSNMISGVVVDESGAPIEGVLVTINNTTVTADGEGNWSANVVGKEITVTGFKEGYGFDTINTKLDDGSEGYFELTGRPQLTLSPEPGYYEKVLAVSLAVAGDSTIYYTLDGSEPDASKTVYTSPFEVADNTVLKAIAVDNNDPSKIIDTVAVEYEIRNLGVLANGGFEFGLEPWVGASSQISITKDEAYSGAHSVLVTQREATGSGPRQGLAGKIQIGETYLISAMVKYDAPGSPEERGFNICFQEGDDWRTINIAASGLITKGEWGLVEGIYEIPAEVERDGEMLPITLQDPRVFVETSWTAEQDPQKDLMDYYVDEFSMTLLD